VSKFELTVITATIVGAVLWIEHGHRIVIDAPAHTDLSSRAPAPACPDNDNVPYSTSCIAFLEGGSTTRMLWRANAATGPVAGPPYAPK
jgi:hypothetical protein